MLHLADHLSRSALVVYPRRVGVVTVDVSLHASRCALAALEELFDELVAHDFCGWRGLHQL